MFIIYSNYTEVTTADTLAAAKRIAKNLSYKYDDTVTIWEGGYYRYFAQHGGLYALRRTN